MKYVSETKEKGFTLLEVVVAVSILLIVGAVAAGVLIKHVRSSQAAAAAESIASIRAAIVSAETTGGLEDADNDSNYLDDLVRIEKLSSENFGIAGANATLKRISSDGLVVYYLSIQCSTDNCRKTIDELDQKLDNGDGPTSGAIQWS